MKKPTKTCVRVGDTVDVVRGSHLGLRGLVCWVNGNDKVELWCDKHEQEFTVHVDDLRIDVGAPRLCYPANGAVDLEQGDLVVFTAGDMNKANTFAIVTVSDKCFQVAYINTSEQSKQAQLCSYSESTFGPDDYTTHRSTRLWVGRAWREKAPYAAKRMLKKHLRLCPTINAGSAWMRMKGGLTYYPPALTDNALMALRGVFQKSNRKSDNSDHDGDTRSVIKETRKAMKVNIETAIAKVTEAAAIRQIEIDKYEHVNLVQGLLESAESWVKDGTIKQVLFLKPGSAERLISPYKKALLALELAKGEGVTHVDEHELGFSVTDLIEGAADIKGSLSWCSCNSY